MPGIIGQSSVTGFFGTHALYGSIGIKNSKVLRCTRIKAWALSQRCRLIECDEELTPAEEIMSRGIHLGIIGLVITAGRLLLAQEPVSTAPLQSEALRSWNPRATPIVHVVSKVRHADVNIHSERGSDGSASSGRVNGMGTGIIIDPRGYVVTNYHVIEDVMALRVRLADGSSFHARVLARDPETDLALVKFESPKPLQVAPLGTARDLMVGETVIAIGNAFGYEHTVTVGVVSAINRDVSLNKDLGYKSLIQTDASINPGNSGGPLLNVLGEVVGLNVAIRREAQGIGFAIPAETLIRVSGEMLAGRRRRLNSGMTLRDELMLPRQESQSLRRVVVERVEPESIAAKAGLKAGDILTKADDSWLGSTLDWERCLIERKPGEPLDLCFARSGQQLTGKLNVDRPVTVANPDDLAWSRIGIRVTPVSGEQVSKIHPQLHGGLYVTEVQPESHAAKAGIIKGDTLIGLHQWEMLTIDNLVFVLNHNELPALNPIKFFVLRGGQLHRGLVQCLSGQ